MKVFIEENTKEAMKLLSITQYPFSEITLKEKYRTAILKCHPDKNEHADAEEKTKQVNAAHTLLKNLAMSEPTEEKANIIKAQYKKEKEDMFIFWEKCKHCNGTGKRIIKEPQTQLQLLQKQMPKYRAETCLKCMGNCEIKREIFNPVIPKGAILK